MTIRPDPDPSAGGGLDAAPASPARRRILDPLDRASEVLFGLIMVLTFTLSLGGVEAGRADVRAVLIGALGCNLAWAFIDAILYLLGARGSRGIASATVRAIRDAESPALARAIVAENLPPAVLPALADTDLERIRLHLVTIPEERLQPRITREDYLAASGIFLLVFFCVFPVVLPFLIVQNVATALRLSNVVAIGLLFLTGFAFGRDVGRPWRTGLAMIAVGIALVAIAMALGG
jgi:VIT1/CCC1 family predicted Fe2+/Mn2+ transporter